ncbi:MAG: insulinase family protein, partial [Clostridia bacterium]|nr:insulinase family protein [Clostridia bacterium]
QEIRMYDDDPEWRVFFNAIDCMYQNHPVKKDIAGTVESIAKIDKDLLFKCYNTFYNPSNMILFTCGDVDCLKVSNMVDKYIASSPASKIKRIVPKEPAQINKPYKEQNLSISIPIFYIGFKDTDVGFDGEKLLKKDIINDLITEIMLGDGSDLYNRLYDDGLINDSFNFDFESEIDYGFTIIGGESQKPKEVHKIILDAFENAVINDSELTRAKKVITADFLRMWNSVEGVSNKMISALFKNIDLFEYQKIIKSITLEDVNMRLKSHFTSQNCVLSVINPYESKGDKQ